MHRMWNGALGPWSMPYMQPGTPWQVHHEAQRICKASQKANSSTDGNHISQQGMTLLQQSLNTTADDPSHPSGRACENKPQTIMIPAGVIHFRRTHRTYRPCSRALTAWGAPRGRQALRQTLQLGGGARQVLAVLRYGARPPRRGATHTFVSQARASALAGSPRRSGARARTKALRLLRRLRM